MSAQILPFPGKTASVSDRAAIEHMLVALTQRDRLKRENAGAKLFIEFEAVRSGLDGVAQFLRVEKPGITDAGIGEYLSTAVAHYRTQVLGLVE